MSRPIGIEFDASTTQKLRESVRGRSDEELLEALAECGFERTLLEALARRSEVFLPARAEGRAGGIHYVVSSPDGERSFHMVIADRRCTSGLGPPPSARITLHVSAPDLLRICAGLVAPQLAYFEGKLKVSGDMLFAQALGNAFRKR